MPYLPLPFKGRDGVGMGQRREALSDPIALPASPLKGEERGALA
jgi:hypothetical protein